MKKQHKEMFILIYSEMFQVLHNSLSMLRLIISECKEDDPESRQAVFSPHLETPISVNDYTSLGTLITLATLIIDATKTLPNLIQFLDSILEVTLSIVVSHVSLFLYQERSITEQNRRKLKRLELPPEINAYIQQRKKDKEANPKSIEFLEKCYVRLSAN